jgi:hypothetical protein
MNPRQAAEQVLLNSEEIISILKKVGVLTLEVK